MSERELREGFPLYLFYQNKKVYSIMGYVGLVDKYIDKKGYIDPDTGNIYIYTDKSIPKTITVPLLDKNLVKHEINSKDESIDPKEFHEDNLKSISVSNIIKNTNEKEELYDEQVLLDMNSSTSRFKPTINENDDFLKKVIKLAILTKGGGEGCDLSRFKSKMPNKYEISNIKSALAGTTKMSTPMFNIWCDLLSLDYEIIVHDTGEDKIEELGPNKGIRYRSSDSSVELIDLK